MTPSFLFSLPKAFTSTGNLLNLPIKMFSYGDAYASISRTCINTEKYWIEKKNPEIP